MLKKEFEYFGPIKEIILVKHRQTGKPRGYAFIEFDREKDMKQAFKEMDGVKIGQKRIVVDVERGRTVKGWRPRRLGQGLGYSRLGPKDICQHYPGRDTRQRVASSPPSSSESSSYRRRRRSPYDDEEYSRKRHRSRSPPRYSGSSRDYRRH
ncbi:U1 small nuclear ribonucleoprotein 70 kDa [Coelomomyces lativittatus]|nr:U1 small nuclear ribonucleoprotein 70 kDa [Coelomomyces lativittatus]